MTSRRDEAIRAANAATAFSSELSTVLDEDTDDVFARAQLPAACPTLQSHCGCLYADDGDMYRAECEDDAAFQEDPIRWLHHDGTVRQFRPAIHDVAVRPHQMQCWSCSRYVVEALEDDDHIGLCDGCRRDLTVGPIHGPPSPAAHRLRAVTDTLEYSAAMASQAIAGLGAAMARLLPLSAAQYIAAQEAQRFDDQVDAMNYALRFEQQRRYNYDVARANAMRAIEGIAATAPMIIDDPHVPDGHHRDTRRVQEWYESAPIRRRSLAWSNPASDPIGDMRYWINLWSNRFPHDLRVDLGADVTDAMRQQECEDADADARSIFAGIPWRTDSTLPPNTIAIVRSDGTRAVTHIGSYQPLDAEQVTDVFGHTDTPSNRRAAFDRAVDRLASQRSQHRNSYQQQHDGRRSRNDPHARRPR